MMQSDSDCRHGRSRCSPFLPPTSRCPSRQTSEIRAHFDRYRNEYTAPERVRLRYLEISIDEIAAGIKADDEELRALFDAEPERFVTPEKREVSHILLAVPSSAGADEAAQAKERLVALKGRILAGESFEDLARENSDDPGSAASGGTLGFIERGMMVPEFEEAAFALAPTAVERFRCERALDGTWSRCCLCRSLATQRSKKFATRCWNSIRRAKRSVSTWSEWRRLQTSPTNILNRLKPAARELELLIRETGPVTARRAIGPTRIASQPAVVAAAFSSDVLDDGNNR